APPGPPERGSPIRGLRPISLVTPTSVVSRSGAGFSPPAVSRCEPHESHRPPTAGGCPRGRRRTPACRRGRGPQWPPPAPSAAPAPSLPPGPTAAGCRQPAEAAAKLGPLPADTGAGAGRAAPLSLGSERDAHERPGTAPPQPVRAVARLPPARGRSALAR